MLPRPSHTLLPALLLAACAPDPSPTVGELESSLTVCPAGPVVEGIDVYHGDGVIDWVKVHNAGVGFTFIKATENIDFIDPQFKTNWTNAGKAGLLRGAYHFFHPDIDPLRQAEFFVQNAGIPGPGDLPPVLDLETNGGLQPAAMAQAAMDFLGRLELLTQRTPIIYTSARVFTDYKLGGYAGFNRYPLWAANWSVMCPNIPSPPWNNWQFWQYTDKAIVAGVAQGVDADQFNGSLADLQKLFTLHPDMAMGADMTMAARDGGADAGDAGKAMDAGKTVDLATAPDLGAPMQADAAAAIDLAVVSPPGSDTGGCEVARAGGSPASGAGLMQWMALLLAAIGLRRWARRTAALAAAGASLLVILLAAAGCAGTTPVYETSDLATADRPRDLSTGRDLTVETRDLSLPPDFSCTLGGPDHCGTCETVCPPGKDSVSTARTCSAPTAEGKCDITCLGEYYDVNALVADGCETIDEPVQDTPQAAVMETLYDENDVNMVRNPLNLLGKIYSDGRTHAEAPLQRPNGREEWYRVKAIGTGQMGTIMTACLSILSLPMDNTFEVCLSDVAKTTFDPGSCKTVSGGAKSVCVNAPAKTDAGDPYYVRVRKTQGTPSLNGYALYLTH